MFGGRFWRQLAGLAGEMALEQAIGGQMVPQMVLWRGGEPAPMRHQLSEPGPRGGVGEGIILMYMRFGAHSTRPEARRLGGFKLHIFPSYPRIR